MSSSNSCSSSYSNPSVYLPNEIEEENEQTDPECNFEVDHREEHGDLMDNDMAYFDEPIADESWLAEYNKQQEEDKKQMEELELRWSGSKLASWCSCGNCNIELLENAKECWCCREIKNCVQCTTSCEDIDKQTLKCIVDHPGFSAIRLNRWSLELAADNFKTRDGYRYSQSSSKERFLRVVAYRQFTRLVHGRLKYKRTPLPSCAYNAIRSTHKARDDTHFTGYEELEEDVEELDEDVEELDEDVEELDEDED